jgi:hypothetical protein
VIMAMNISVLEMAAYLLTKWVTVGFSRWITAWSLIVLSKHETVMGLYWYRVTIVRKCVRSSGF